MGALRRPAVPGRHRRTLIAAAAAAVAVVVVLAPGGSGAVGAAAAADGPAAAAAPDGGFLIASRRETGYVDLGVFGQAPGSSVVFAERTGAGVRELATVPVDGVGFAPLLRAVSWRCDRTVRRFAATLTAPDGATRVATTDIRTPSCANRVALIVPRRVARGGLLTIRLVDRWGLGDRSARLCVGGARLAPRCRTLRLSARARGVVRRVRPPADGQVRVAVVLAGQRVRQTVAAGAARALPVTAGPLLLTTGDSTIEGIDSALEDGLGSAARVRAESAPGTRLSGTGEAAWLRRGASQVRRLRPRVTVVSLGANESFPVTAAGGAAVDCCGPAWVDGLARRQRRLMDVYRQGGRGTSLWLLLPAPRSAAQAEVIAAADRAVLAAAAGRRDVRVLDLRAIFTPDGVYRAWIRRAGRLVRVRAPDGLHLSAAGQAIAAGAVRALLTRDGLLD